MWRTLTEDAREAIRELCDGYGPHLYDYCRTELSSSDAELAVAGALLSAHARAGRVDQDSLLRPWLYALARAHRTYLSSPTSVGSWSRPGRMSELLPEALRALDRPHRELLDLSVRHGLTNDEIAAIFDVDPDEVESIVLEAADGLEEWFAAVIAARTRHGCAALEARVTEWAATPGRRTRARISRHIAQCDVCRRAPRTMVADTLLRQMPITPAPSTLHEQLAWALPLPGDDGLWRENGFPVQAHGLTEPAPPPISPVPGPTTGTRESSGPAAGAAAAGPEHTCEPAALRPARKHARPGPPDQGAGVEVGAPVAGDAVPLEQPGLPPGRADRSSDRSPEWAIVRRTRGGVPYRNLPAASAHDRWSSGPAGQQRAPLRRAEGGPPWEHHPDDGPPWAAGDPDAPGGGVPAPRVAQDDATDQRAAARGGGDGRKVPTSLPTDRMVAGRPRKSGLILSAPVPGDELLVAPLPRPETAWPRETARRETSRPQESAPQESARQETALWESARPQESAHRPAWTLTVSEERPPERVWVGAPPVPAPRPAEMAQVVELRGGEEFWRNRPDEDPDDSAITVRTVARVGLLVGVGLLVAGLAWSGLNARQRMPSVSEVSASEPATTPQGRPSPGPAVVVPPPAEGVPTGAAPSPSEIARPTPPPTRAANADGTGTRGQAGPNVAGTMSPASRAGAAPGSMESDDAGQARVRPTARQAVLPRPRPPVASVSPATIRLGERRTGTFALACRGGSCRVASAAGTKGIVVSGRSFRVKAPKAVPACPGPDVTRTGTIVVRWTGVARGDGRATAGTATGGGTLRIRVTWTISRDPGAYIVGGQHGGAWSNCARY